jgi:hypothetical protein
MSVHWWMLSAFVEGLNGRDKMGTIFFGMFLILPLILSLSVIFVAARIDTRMILPAAVGVMAVPVAASSYGLVAGLAGCLRPARGKELDA